MSVTDSPFQITPSAAKEVLDKSPEPQEALPVDPIGKLLINKYCMDTCFMSVLCFL